MFDLSFIVVFPITVEVFIFFYRGSSPMEQYLILVLKEVILLSLH